MAEILWAATYQLGGFSAGVPILSELQSRGHRITGLSIEAAARKMAQFGFLLRTPFSAKSYDWTRRDEVPADLCDFSFANYRQLLLDPIPREAGDVALLLESEHFDFVLTDGATYGAGLAAERGGLPWAAYVAFAFDESTSFSPSDALAFRSLWNTFRATLGLGPDPRPWEETPWLPFSRHLTLLLGHPALAFRRSALPHYFRRVGPLSEELPLTQEHGPWLRELGRLRPAVLVSTSSAWVDEVDLIRKVGHALGDEDLDVVLTVPAEHALPPLPSNFRTMKYFPHGLLLQKVSALICSGSYGVVTKAACAGIPIVAIPYGGDGHCVSLAAAKAGVAIALDPHKMTSRGLRSAVHQVLTDTRYSNAARGLSIDSERYDGVGMAADAIEGLMNQR